MVVVAMVDQQCLQVPTAMSTSSTGDGVMVRTRNSSQKYARIEDSLHRIACESWRSCQPFVTFSRSRPGSAATMTKRVSNKHTNSELQRDPFGKRLPGDALDQRCVTGTNGGEAAHLLSFASSVMVRNLLSEHSSRLEQQAMEARQAHESLGQCG